MKRKFLCLALATSLVLTSVPAVNVQAATSTNVAATSVNEVIINEQIYDKVITISDYDDNTFLKNVGTKRGDYQVREVIPFILPAGESLTIKQIGGTEQYDISLELKTGISTNDVTGTIKKSGQSLTVKAKTESVVYVKVPRTRFNNIVLQYSMSKATSLPVFTQNITNEKTFFDIWDTAGTKNAIIQNEDIIIQVPEINKEELRNLKNNNQFIDINNLLKYYQNMIDYYDTAYGLEGKSAYNYSPSQKYLIVPELTNSNANGVVYSDDIIRAYGSSTGVSKVLKDDMDTKNAIAKGYQGDMVKNDVNVDGVWGSIIAHYFAMQTNSADRSYSTNYIYNKSENQRNLYSKALSLRGTTGNGTYTLDFFRNIFDVYGINIFKEFNQEYRRLGLTGEHDDQTNTNTFAKYFSEAAKIDLVPYFLSYGHSIDENVIAATSDFPKAYYLTDIVKTESTKDYLIDTYNLASEFALIDTSVFVEDRGVNLLKGSVTVYLEIDNTSEFSGKQVMLKNGKTEYFADIVNGRASFTNIPLGVYNIFTPMTNSGKYIKKVDNYVVIGENDNKVVNGKYTRLNDFYLNLNYDFIIETDEDETALRADLRYLNEDDYKLTINTYETINNINATSNSVYGYIKVYDDKNRVIEITELLNLSMTRETTKEFFIRKGYKIAIYRVLNEDKKYVNNILTGIDVNNDSLELVQFDITSSGLVSNSTNVVKTVTDSYISKGRDSYFKVANQYINSNYRAYLANAISHLSDSEQQVYKSNYAQTLRLNNPVLTVSQNQIIVPLNANIDYSEYATAKDVEDGDISRAIKAKDTTVNLEKEGTYSTTLRVEDSDHNFDETRITVVVDKNANKTSNNNNTNTSNSNVVKPKVTITGRSTYDVMVEVIDQENNSQFSNLSDKNTVVPYYTNPDGTKVQAKFSHFDTSTNELLYLNNVNGSNFRLENNPKNFNDTSNYWAKSNIDFVASRGIITGVTDSYFLPKGEVSRAMTVTILGRLSDVNVSNRTSMFKDVPIATWYTGYVNWAKTNNIINGLDETHFNPNGTINREQLAVAINNYLKYLGYNIESPSTVTKFTDDAKISSWAKDAVYTLRSIGVVNGDSLGKYNPQSYLSRAELSAIIERLVIYTIEAEQTAGN